MLNINSRFTWSNVSVGFVDLKFFLKAYRVLLLIVFIVTLLGCTSNSRNNPPLPNTNVETEPGQDTQANINNTDSKDAIRKQYDTTVIELRKNNLYFKGNITNETPAIFRDFIAKNAKAKYDTLVINSHGGVTTSAREIAQIVIDKGLSVRVEEFCFSSCANYVFVAGKNKIIEKDAIVGWHGSEHQSYYFAKQNNSSVEAELEKDLGTVLKNYNLSEEDIQKSLDVNLKLFSTTLQQEKEFFQSLNINIYLTLTGIIKRDNDAEYDNYIGWTYTIEDMQRFGLKNVKYESGAKVRGTETREDNLGAYPNPDILAKYNVYLETVDETDLEDSLGIR